MANWKQQYKTMRWMVEMYQDKIVPNMRKVIEDMKKSMVTVVKCKDCKYSFRNNGHDKSGCPIIDSHIWMDEQDFCSRGERREENAAD